MKKILFICSMLLVFPAFTQFQISGKIADKDNETTPFAVVLLEQDSTLIQSLLADSLGQYQFLSIPAGKYQMTFSYLGAKEEKITFFLNKDTIVNVQFSTNLQDKGMEIVANKPLIENLIDRLRFNVANTDIVYGASAWDVIVKTPTVEQSGENGLGISGVSGAVVYINNRKSFLAGDALANYLKNMPATNIQAIEVMSTPPSKYDAGGGAGIIRIVLKKNQEEGLKGTASINVGKAAYASPSFSNSLNFQKKKWGIATNLSASSLKRRTTHSKNIQYFTPSDTLETQIEEIAYVNRSNSLSADISIDYQLNKNHCFGFMTEASHNVANKSRYANSYFNPRQIDSLSYSANLDKDRTQDVEMNVNYEGKLDSLGKKINVDIDFLRYNNTVSGESKTTFMDENTRSFLYIKNDIRSSVPQNITNYSAKIDFECPFNDNISLETGLKTTTSLMDNDLVFAQRINQVFVKDTSRSRLFGYKEDIHAFYFIWNQKWNDKWHYQLGVRAENTIAKGTVNQELVVNRNYLNLFPTGFLKYSHNKQNSFTLVVTSRINRPNFWDLNPYRNYVTDKLFKVGNPYLLPSNIYKEELTYSLRNSYFVKLVSTQTIRDFYPMPVPQGDDVMERRTNYGSKYNYGATFIVNKEIKPWWKLNGSIRGVYMLTRGGYDNISIENRSFFVGFTSNQTFTISKEKTLTCSVIIENDFPATFSNTHIGNRLYTTVKFRKSFWEGKGNLALTFNDLFKTAQDRYTVQLPTMELYDRYYNNTRYVYASFTYQFGNTKVKENREREAGNQAEKGRV